ncbi:carbohydrate ABC transporter permease [Candidatus Clostridium radicumherbarum]|uniref:Carbohydrate ABC transporter permease n=1 Tax=Candidatus Clostridium radicumherbarum TaxID=3381662 RepID=A0ABW8TRJ4_9CLOT
MSKFFLKENGIITQSDLKRTRVKILYFVMFITCILITLFSIAPPIWLFLQSFKDIKEFTLTQSILPKTFDFSKFVGTWNELKFYKYYINSFYSVTGSIICAVVFNGLLAYSISIIKPKGSKFVYTLVISSLMIPATTSIVPLFVNISKLHLNGSFIPLWLSVGANAFYVVLFKEFFDTLPKSVIEAARIDGCSNVGIFFKIIMPLSKPITMVIVMYALNAAWSDFLLPSLLLNNTGLETVMVRLFQFKDAMGSQVDMLRAIVFAMIPPIILFTIFQKQITQGITHSGIKG